MEPLHRMFQHAQRIGLIHRLHKCCDNFRMFLYADDTAVFIHPTVQDFEATKLILTIFGKATGLVANMDKTEIFPIRCENINLEQILGQNTQTSNFPCTYLGLPLHRRKLPRSTVQPLVQKIANRLPGWKRRFFTYPGRELQCKTVLAAMPTYFLTCFKVPGWAIHRIDRYIRSFLWRGDDPENVRGGHCLVNWQKCTRPKKLGGLGITDIAKFNRALRLRWMWYSWDQQQRPWQGLLKIKDPVERHLFFASTTMEVGNGNITPFWEANWINGTSPKAIAPNLYERARFKYRSVSKELHNSNWIRNIGSIDSEMLLQEYVTLFTVLRDINLTGETDRVKWRWTANG